MKKTQCIIFHFCFIFRVFCFQAKEVLTVLSSILHLIPPVGYNVPQKLIHAEWLAVLWENKMVWLQLLSHEIMKKKNERLEYTMCQNWSFSHWFRRTGIWDDPWQCQGQQRPVSEVFEGLHVLGTRAKVSGTSWCLKCSCKTTESLLLPRGWHQS